MITAPLPRDSPSGTGRLLASERKASETLPLLDSKLVRLRCAWYYRIKSPSGPSSVLAALGTPQPSFWTLNAVEPTTLDVS